MAIARVLDSWVLLAYFEGEAAGRRAKEILMEALTKNRRLLLSVVNWGEVLYTVAIRYGKERRDAIEGLIDQMQLQIVDADRNLTREAARLKAARKLPYADAFAMALALREEAELVTGDRDFEALQGAVKIHWL